MTTFSELGLTEALSKNIGKLGFETPTPIQAEAIPHLLKGNTDLVGLAQTGTGKTAAFGLPMIDMVSSRSKQIQGLVICPTRELCLQIHRELTNFSSHRSSLGIVAVYGGADIRRQMRSIKDGAQIIIATPGRLLDLMNRKVVKLDKLKTVVLDEADEMLNMGFQEDIDSILEGTPEDRNTWLFSATMPKSVERIAKRYMRDPIELSAGTKNTANRDISHQYIITKKSEHINLLKLFLDAYPDIFGLVFCRTRRDTKDVAEQLESAGYSADALHGDLNQGQRDRVMNRFRKRKLQVLVATDVAARGIDVNDITHVFNFNIPDDLAFYTHRSGRTARAGKKGESIIFLSTRERSKIRRLEKIIQAQFKEIRRPDTSKILINKVTHFLETILTTEIHPNVEKVMEETAPFFEDMSKEEFLGRILSRKFKKTLETSYHEPERRKSKRREDFDDSRDFSRKKNRSDFKSKRRDDKKSEKRDYDQADYFREDSGHSEDLQKMFINLGSSDFSSKKDLQKFIIKKGGVSKMDIIDIDFDKRHSYFFINRKLGKKLNQAFKGVEHEGRELRVNPDGGREDGGKKKKKGKKNKKQTLPKGKRRKAFRVKADKK